MTFNLFNLLTSYLSIYFFASFLIHNIKEINTPGGYHFLVLFLVTLFVVFISGNLFKYLKKINYSFLFLALFIMYFILITFITSFDLSFLKQVTIGTTGGVLFGLICGIGCSLIIAKIYEISIKNRKLRNCSLALYFIFLLIILAITINAFESNLRDIRSDIFLIRNQLGLYQRPGSFMFIIYMILSSIGALHISISKNISFMSLLFGSILLIVLASILMMMSQLIGSNSGTVSIFGFLIINFIFISMISFNKDFLNRMKIINFWNLIFSSLGIKYFFYFPMIILILLFSLNLLLEYSGISLESLRIFGFGTNFTSIINRLDLLQNFPIHFNHSPVFGNMIVDRITTGEGSYLHSLFSILTHLGIIGSLIFVTFLSKLFSNLKVIKTTSDLESVIFNNKKYMIYRIIAMSTVIIYCIFSAFFTWLPLWFAFGLFGLNFIKINEKKFERDKIEKNSKYSIE